jgi:hypothetical protein
VVGELSGEKNMHANRTARRGTWLVAAVIGLVAPLLSTGPAQAVVPAESAASAAASASPEARGGVDCQGSVMYFGTPAGAGRTNGNVRLDYRVTCPQRMQVIVMKTRIDNNTTGDRPATNTKTCYDAVFCDLRVVKDDNPSGWQSFAGFGIDCGMMDCGTYAKPYSGSGSYATEWPCRAQQCFHGTGLELRRITE